MANFTVTILDEHVTRLTNAIDSTYPTWREDYPSFTLKEMAEKITKEYLKNFVRRYEIQEQKKVYSENVNNITDID